MAGVALSLFCVTKDENKEMDDMGDSGGILLKSNTEAPGDQLVRSSRGENQEVISYCVLLLKYLFFSHSFPSFW